MVSLCVNKLPERIFEGEQNVLTLATAACGDARYDRRRLQPSSTGLDAPPGRSLIAPRDIRGLSAGRLSDAERDKFESPSGRHLSKCELLPHNTLSLARQDRRLQPFKFQDYAIQDISSIWQA